MEIKPKRLAEEIIPVRLAVDTRPERFAVLTIDPKTILEIYPADPRPTTVEPICVAR